ncbi:carbohydrate ABC transporter permease [Mollicutes bacterium LVI A0039]|nr:carbohydrate ABC transporter permease [Mollicutes bacterium LVI A0039]
MWKKIKNTPSGDYPAYIIIYGLLIAIVILTLYPLFYVFVGSFMDPYELLRNGINLDVSTWSLDSYSKIFSNSDIVVGFKNSMIYSFTFATLSVIITLLFAYPLTQKELKSRKVINYAMIITMFLGGGLIPTYLLIRNLGMLNSPLAIIIPGLFNVWNIILVRTFIKGIPADLQESAKIDGASHFIYFFKVLLPLCVPIIAVIFLYSFVGMWNSYFDAMIYIDDRSLQPLQLVLRRILIQNEVPPGMIAEQQAANQLAMLAEQLKYASIVVSSIPLLIMYPFFQKYFEKGAMVGSIKG